MTVVRITVLKRALHADLAKALSASEIRPCEVFSEGQEFIASFNMPEGFCQWAWTDIARPVLALQTGGRFDQGLFRNWMKDDHSAVACCTDGLRPVTFKLERVDTRSLVDVSRLERPAPAEAYVSERWGEFAYGFSGLPPGGRCLVRLHFCEIFFSAAGRRRFAVEANGRRLLDDFDIFKETGGMFRPVIREAETDADKRGELIIRFLKGAADQPQVCAIEVIDRASGKAGHAVNAGGPASGPFAADRDFTGGSVTGG